MLILQRHLSRPAVLTGLACILIVYFFLTTHSVSPGARTFHGFEIRPSSSLPPKGYAPGLVSYWKELAKALEDARPQCQPISVVNEPMSPSDKNWEPLVEKKRPVRLNLAIEDEQELTQKHRQMRLSARRLAPTLPVGQGTGIVTTGGLKLFPMLLVSLRMLRRTGCTLPVQVFLGDQEEYAEVAAICEGLLPTLNAHCQVISDIYAQAGVAKPDHFQFKILSILFSAFERLLFLDADAFPAHDPTPLLQSVPFTTHGLVTWPGFYANTASEHFYHIASIPALPPNRGTESGQLLLNKHQNRESLLMMVYYNYYGPKYYYPLQSQNGPGQGDKETFGAAAMAVNTPFYAVMTPPHMMGIHVNGTFVFAGAAQADPMQDLSYAPPAPNHSHEKYQWSEDDAIGAQDPSKTMARSLFVHTVSSDTKLDPGKLLRKGGLAYMENGDWHRIWGTEEWVVDKFGYDVEKRMWECVQEEACRMEEALCNEVKAYRAKVFG